MKRTIKTVVSIVIVITVSIAALYSIKNSSYPFSPSTILPNEKAKEILVSIDFGNGTIRSTTVSAQTPLEAVEKAAIEGGFVIVKKDYDFGALIISINGFENSSLKAWMYYVNGKAGMQASNMMQLSPSDMVEWKYQLL